MRCPSLPDRACRQHLEKGVSRDTSTLSILNRKLSLRKVVTQPLQGLESEHRAETSKMPMNMQPLVSGILSA